MKVRNVKTKKIFFSFVALFVLTSFSFFIYVLLTGSISFGSKEDIWDGETIASSFGTGNGTKDNPYIIKTPDEFVYFKTLIEGDNYKAYQDKYYALDDDLNFGDKSFSSIGIIDLKDNDTEEKIFKGYFDGRGHSIFNLKIDKEVVIDNTSYYSLFTKTENATIENLIMKSFKIKVNDNEKDIVTGFIGDILTKDFSEEENEERILSQFRNISLIDFEIDYSDNKKDNNKISIFTNSVSKNSNLSNLYFIGRIKGNNSNSNIGIVTDKIEGKISKIVSNIVLDDVENVDFTNEKIENHYIIKDGNIYLNGEVVSNESLLFNLNDNKDNDYYWDYENNEFTLKKYEKKVNNEVIDNRSRDFSFSIRVSGVDNITAHDSGLDGNTFYINDLTADYNYLKGLNYTEVRNTSLPINNSGYYNDNNLVKVQITYDGVDVNNNSIVGAMSPVAGESSINKFVYYKYYGLERDGNGTLLTNSNGDNYIRIELIDNPFSKRPYFNNDEYGFNGWICNQDVASSDSLCESSKISFKKSNYTRYMEIPVTGGSEIMVHLNASWVKADVVTSQNSISSFKSMSMESMSEFAYYTTENIQGKAYWKQNYTTMVFTRTYVYNDRYMPQGIWYKTNQSSTSYTYVNNRRTRCPRNYTCYAYEANTSGIVGGTEYTSGNYTFVPDFRSNANNTEITIYYYDRNYMNLVADPNGNFWDTVQVPHYTTTLVNGNNASGLFYQVNNPTTAMINTGEYYEADGDLCANANSCTTAYKLIKYNDSLLNSQGNTISVIETLNGEIVDVNKYYYLVTRDTNIFRYTSNSSLTASNIAVNKPFTVTGTAVNSVNVTGVINISNNLTVQNDLVIENIKFTGANGGITNNDFGQIGNNPSINASSHNLKIGRNVSNSTNTNNMVAHTVYGGTTGTFRVIIESGNYNGFYAANNGGNFTMNETIILGNDYDRIREDTSKLKMFVGYLCNRNGTLNGGNDSVFATFVTFKSGIFGFNPDGSVNTDADGAGAYIGGRGTGSLTYAATGMKNEGATIGVVLGGSGYRGSNTTNSTFIGMSGGRIRQIYGGATTNTTYGNRIINVTGGSIDYSILGGSNSNNGTSSTGGILEGDTVVYAGGNAVIGTVTTGTLNDVEPGCVFGAGGGAQGYSARGAVRSSHIIVNGATVNNGVYGGGNYGSTGTQYAHATSSIIDIFSGNIANVYGGSRSANFSQSSYNTSSTININVYNGTIGNIYGGSDDEGTVYGIVNINVHDGNITNNVYGGGRGSNTFVDSSVNVVIGDTTVNHPTISGSVYGGSAYGTVNAASTNGPAHGNTNVTINNGVISNSVFGGAQGSNSATPYVLGNITVNINDGSIGKVFGGFDASGKPSAGNVVYLNGGTVGDAFGGGNNANQDATDIRLQGSTITGNLYGGSNLLGTVTQSNVTVTSGSVTDIYGGNNLDGLTVTTNVSVTGATITGDIYGGGNEASSGTSNVIVSGYIDSLQDVYGGGKKAGVTTTNVTIQNDNIHQVFGGSNVSGNVTTSNVHINSSTVLAAYGGNNQGGETSITNIDTKGSTITNLFGGGDNAHSGTSNVIVYNGTITNVYGGGNEAGVTTSNVLAKDGSITNLFGGSNESGDVGQSNVQLGSAPLDVVVEYTKRAPGNSPRSNKPTYAEITVTVNNTTDLLIDEWEVVLNIPNSTVYSNSSQSNINVSGDIFTINEVNRYSGVNSIVANGSYSFSFSILSDTPLADFTAVVADFSPTASDSSNLNVVNVFGGNNQGGVTTSTNINAIAGSIHTIYGGGNEASVGSTNVVVGDIMAVDIYGGGNAAGVTGNTLLDIDGSSVSNNIYGGGNEGIVAGSTSVFITDAHIAGNAFAGGNGSTAVVHTNSTITIDGTTEIGTNSSVAPDAGCVFGSGNAASTGIEGVDTSVATVNLVGGIIHGNVYGGPKMAVVYGTTDTNIGTSAVSVANLIEDDIHISGTVFGGGESNASGSETYDWTFISVTRGIDVTIDGTGYISNNHDFIMNGSVFGSGNASSSSGTSNITIKNLGSREAPNKSISVQRANNLIIDHSVIELEGTTDRTNEYSDIFYSFNIIDKLIIKNDTVLLLQHNANLLKELYSGVDSNNTLVPATVEIDDENESVTKNVDNRIYMLPGQNLNVTINQAATAYGKVTGMTFFGMYTGYDNGTYRYGLYDDDLDYGDTGNAGLEIVGGSYVIGLHSVNHDITKDGFYSNYLNDDYTEITVAYIDPSTIGETGYRWIIGFEAINYEFTLNASKYSSLGTYELQLIDFADGNTNFSAIGFDSSGLNPDIQLVDSNNVPRVARTMQEANSILGLSMKAETQEWTGYGTTKLLSRNGGDLTGDRDYKTDSRKLPPSLMFYLYHAKNINAEGRLGTVVLTLRADIPKNAIEYDIKFITVTINIVARRYDDADSYDASITYDKRYEMPSSTLVNITNQSQFSTYYSLIAWNDNFSSVYGNNNQNYHVLTTNYPLPVNTMITMLDYGANDNRPDYYYFTVTQAIYNDSLQQLSQYNEVVYPLRNFIKMDSTSSNNTYQDSVANMLYYDADAGLVDEEFMFIFDFKETTTTGEHLDNTMLFELRNHEDRTVYNVLGIRESLMVYNTYDSSNIVLEQTFSDTDSYLYYNIPDEFSYSTRIQYNQTENRQSVIDTNYESSSMGLNVSLYDKDGIAVSSSMLIGTSIEIDNHEYFADGDGIFRIKLANKVSNLDKLPKLTVTKDLPAGEYKIRYTLFASDDGLHNSIYENSVTQEFTVYVVNSDNSIVVDCDDEYKIVDGETGLNMKNNTTNIYHVKYLASLNNPNFRVELFKRNVDNASTTGFTSVPFRTLFSNAFPRAAGNEVYLDMNGLTERNFDFNFQTELTSGTYRLVFKLYDNDQLIDTEIKYIIVNKKTE